MEWLSQLLQDLSLSDGWSGWKVILVSSVIGGIFGLAKWYVNKRNTDDLPNKDSDQEGKMIEKKGEEQKTSLTEEIEAIEKLHANARDKQAYENFFQLCKNYPDYQSQAAIFLNRYQSYQQQVFAGILSKQDDYTEKMKIANSFQTCLQQFKQEFL